MDLLFTVVFTTNLVAVTAVVFSILKPEKHIWPPPGNHPWEYLVIWVLDGVCSFGVPTVAFLDRGSLGFRGPATMVLGGSLVVSSLPLVIWAVRTLSISQSFGLKGELITDGPYSYSRNPQYLGFTLLYGGIILLADSVKGLLVGAVFILFFLLAPLSEEPWLREQFGEEYDEYLSRIPRFIGWRTFRKPLSGES
ncbi:MAG: isoprenylcysteine carboxylmethyltransferase family protein [Candidatus Bathyarchaeota archaeon]|jgi:protein-S-isoprenylcysteine O-methyltransferase Ste14